MNETQKQRYAEFGARPADAPQPEVGLTLREIKCVSMFISGSDYAEIAEFMELPTPERARQIVAKAGRKLAAVFESTVG